MCLSKLCSNTTVQEKKLVYQTSFKYLFILLVSITSEKIYKRNSKIKLKPMKQKVPIK